MRDRLGRWGLLAGALGLVGLVAPACAQDDALDTARQREAQALYAQAADRLKSGRYLRLTATVAACGEEVLAQRLVNQHLAQAQQAMVQIAAQRAAASGSASEARSAVDTVLLAGVFARGYALGHLNMAPMSLPGASSAAARAEVCDGARDWARKTLDGEPGLR
jgi:hypothetical protein